MQGYRTHFNSSKHKNLSEFYVRIQLLPHIIHKIPYRGIIIYFENRINLSKYCERAKLTLQQVVHVFVIVP